MVELGFGLFLCALLGMLLWRRRRRALPFAILDGSNLIYWRDETPSIKPVEDAIVLLRAEGYTPVVIFDANAGYLVADRYLDGPSFARRLGLPEAHAHVVGRGESADPTILRRARESGGIVVSRDRFRDWLDTYPEAGEAGRVVRGGYRGAKLWIDLKPEG